MNLRDRLNAIGGTPKKTHTEAPAAACLTVTRTHPLAEFPGWEDVTREGLMLMQEEALPDPFLHRRVLYLDTETTGFQGSGTVAFLIGAGYLTDSGFEVKQFLMRDYHEEPDQLQRLQRLLADFDTICTFNGKSFDIPLLRSRFLMNRLRTDCLDRPHIDLLHIARRVWKLRLKQCTLGRLEEMVLGQGREDDLPGSEAPKRFFEYLKTRNMALLEDVRLHNEQDVASMCTLLSRLNSVYLDPGSLTHAQDLLSMGNALQRTSHPQEARRCYRLIPSGSLHAQGQMRLAGSLKREGQREEAIRVWQDMIRRREGGPQPYVELAKYYEHTARDLSQALHMTRMAMACLAEPSLLESPETTALRQELLKRMHRLNDQLQRRGGI